MKGTIMYTLYYKHVVNQIQADFPEYKPSKKEMFKAIAADTLILVGAVSVVAGAALLINSKDEEDTNS